MSVHDGHRQRLRTRFLRDGLSGFEEHEVLELVLFYCIPRRDTNEIAHNLIKRFGSLAKVLDAPIRELERVDGVGKSAAAFLSLLKEVGIRYRISSNENEILNTYEACGQFLKERLMGKKHETVLLLCLDSKCMVISCREVGEGSINSAAISIRKIVDIALAENATSVVLAHNHPGGLAIPSQEDILTTRRVAKALCLVDVILNDHVIATDDDYVSLVLSRLYDPDSVCAELNG